MLFRSDATSQDAAQREFNEEVFTNFDPNRFRPLGAVERIDCFHLDLSVQEANDVVANWRRSHNANLGEVNNVRFEPYAAIGGLPLNPESRKVMRLLPAPPPPPAAPAQPFNPGAGQPPPPQAVAPVPPAPGPGKYIPPHMRKKPGGGRRTRRRSGRRSGRRSRVLKNPKTLKKRIR